MNLQPFKIAVPEETLTDLRKRLTLTRWPTEIEDAAWDYGTNRDYLKEICAYWLNEYDWRAQEAQLNRFAHFKTNLDGLNIHFIHERGKGPNPIPLILTHGWPDSFYRFYKIIPMLTNPAAFGGDPADSFDVIVPSMPGFGFSDPPLQRGMAVSRMAQLWLKLMAELGYERFAAHGGDVGGGISIQLAFLAPEKLIGLHADRVPLKLMAQKIPDITPEEQQFVDGIAAWQRAEGAYAAIQSTKPQSLNYGLTDSPAGLAGWILEKFRAWSDCDGDLSRRYTRDELLTNIMIYWVTNTIGSANRYYFEATRDQTSFSQAPRVEVPTGLAVFPKDILPTPRLLAERWFNLKRFTEMPRGGHFGALEEPELMTEDIRAFFRPLR